jgi:hypothetical protein
MAVDLLKRLRTRAVFAELTGAIEQALATHPGSDTASALWLLESLAHIWRDGELVEARTLTLGEFDGCLADLHATLFGSRLPCEAECVACEKRFEFVLKLPDLRRAIAREAESYVMDANGIVTAPSGRRFRLPCVADLAHIGAPDWLEQFLVEGDSDSDTLESEMDAAACILSQDIDAPCPECEASNTIRFDIARYLVDTLKGEGPFLWREVHLLAKHYGWSLEDILTLTRDVRRQLAGLIVADASARMRLAS